MTAASKSAPNGIRAHMLTDLDGITTRHASVLKASSWMSPAKALTLAAMAALFVYAAVRLDISPGRVAQGFGTLVYFVSLMMPPSSGTWPKFLIYAHALVETIGIAFLGTLLAATIALPFGFLAAGNVIRFGPLRFLTRRASDTIRGIDALIWALIWVGVVGLGPMAGVLALATADIGTFIKIFSEAIETADKKPVDGIVSVGGGRLQSIRFGIVPQVIPVIAGQILYIFESNTRSSTIIGIVGAGGIGLHLSEQIRTLEWQHVSLLIIMILVAVMAIDAVSSRLRLRLAGRTGQSEAV